jgi:uncharacterized protein (DUF58 family)
MLSNDILHKIRQLEIQTKRMLSGSMVGDNTVAQKGFGIEFDQLREYQQGDDIRFIDWRSTARAQKMMVKEYLDDRNRSIHIIVDVSSSLVYGSGLLRKIDISAQVASILALVADYGKDQVAITYIGNDFIDSIQSGRGRAHTHAIMKKMFEYCDQISLDYKPSVDFMKAVHQVMQTQKRASLVCIISDFITEGSYEPFALMRKRHDVIALRVLDPLERSMPAIGLIPMCDIENRTQLLWNSNKQAAVQKFLDERIDRQNSEFKKYKIDCVDIDTQSDLLGNLIRFFRRRMAY